LLEVVVVLAEVLYDDEFGLAVPAVEGGEDRRIVGNLREQF